MLESDLVRVDLLPDTGAYRILDKEATNAEFKTLNLDVLGFEEDTKRQLRKFINEPYGMVLVTGPTGSGKSTLINDVLYRSLAKDVYRSRKAPGEHDAIDGTEQLVDTIEIDRLNVVEKE